MQWLLIFMLASGPFCHAERVLAGTDETLMPDRNASTMTDTVSSTKVESPPPKQPLFQTVAEMGIIDSTGASFAEKLAVGSCTNRVVWAKTTRPRLGAGAYAEIFEVAKFDPKTNAWTSEPNYALKVASTSKGGKPLSPEKIEEEKKNVDAEANLLAKMHESYKRSGKGDLCPNVVPMLSNYPCVYNSKTKTVEMLSGAYVTIKMSGDLQSWQKKRIDPATCPGRGGKDIYREQLLNGLKCVHEHGKIAHHDLKADNVLYEGLKNNCPETLYIADFGLSEPLDRHTSSFSHQWIAKSGHLVEDVMAGGSSNLGIKVFQKKYIYSVFEDIAYKRGTKQVVQNRHAFKGTRKSEEYMEYQKFQDCCTSRLVDDKTPIKVETVEDGYTVVKGIDYCGLIAMVYDVFNWGIYVPGYETKEKLNCGPMENSRSVKYDGSDR